MTPTVAARAAEALLRDGLGLRARPLAPELATMAGEWRGAPAVLTTRAYVGERVRYARVATLVGAGLEIGNVLVVPASGFDAPIFGVDMVEVGRDAALLAADLSPTRPVGAAARARAEAALRAVHAPLAGLPSAGPLPAWAARCFSAAPVFVRVPAERLALAGAAVEGLARWFVDDLRRATVDGTDGCAGEYMAAHLDDARTLGMLAKIFDSARADRYARTVLFPEPEGLS